MAPRRRQPSRPERPSEPAKAPALNTPFAQLRGAIRGRVPAARRVTPPPPAPPPPAAAEPDDDELLTRAMTGVVPLASRVRVDAPPPAAEGRTPTSDEDEALAALADLVRGDTAFDVTDTREYVEGAVVGLDPQLVRKLRRGDFARQAHVDLHGLIADEARLVVERFLVDSVRRGFRCVLIVHGKGLNSKDRTPVLKEKLKAWLSRGRAATVVLAFASARAVDGGSGALYVLLRRDRRRSAIRVTEGTTR